MLAMNGAVMSRPAAVPQRGQGIGADDSLMAFHSRKGPHESHW